MNSQRSASALTPGSAHRACAIGVAMLLPLPVFAAEGLSGWYSDPDDFRFELSGVLMEDFSYLRDIRRLQSPASQWNIRRSTIEAEIGLLQRLTLELDLGVDLEQKDVTWRDAYLDVDLPDKWALRIGKMKQSFGILHTTSLKNQLSPERPMALDMLTLERAPGLSLERRIGKALFSTAYFEAEDDDGETIASALGQFVYEPESYGFQQAGFSVATQDYNQATYRIRTRAGTDVMDNFLRTEKITAERVRYYGPNAAWQRGRFTVLGEALRTEVSSRKEGDRTYTGAYLQASWFFTDDQHRIEDGVLKRVKSGRRPAWELVSTWSRLDAYSQGDGFAGDTLGIGLNYYRSDGIKIMGELNQLDVRKGYQKDQSGLSFILRLQLAF